MRYRDGLGFLGFLALLAAGCSGSANTTSAAPDDPTSSSTDPSRDSAPGTSPTPTPGTAPGPTSPTPSTSDGCTTGPTWKHELTQSYTGDPTQNVFLAFHALAVAPDASIYATGRYSGSADLGDGSKSTASNRTMPLTKWNKDGTLAWSKVYDAASFTVGSALATDASSNLYVGGAISSTVDLGGGHEISAPYAVRGFIAKYTATGSVAWSKTLSPDEDGTRVMQLVVSGNQIFALVGEYGGRPEQEQVSTYGIYRLDTSTGTLSTPTYFAGAYFPQVGHEMRMAPTADGGVFVTYYLQQAYDDYPAQIIKVTSAGSIAFTKTYSDDLVSSLRFEDIAPDGSGGAFVRTHGENTHGFENPSVSRLDATGALVWSRKLTGLRDVAGMHADASSVMVVGTSDGPGSNTTSIDTWSFSLSGVPSALRQCPVPSTYIFTNLVPFHAAFGPKTFALTGETASGIVIAGFARP